MNAKDHDTKMKTLRQENRAYMGLLKAQASAPERLPAVNPWTVALLALSLAIWAAIIVGLTLWVQAR